MARKLVVVLAIGAAAVITPAGPAHASEGCTFSRIVINSNPGAEPPSSALGHRHPNGDAHYIRSIHEYGNRRVLEWWADNNGGSDGDTADTFYATAHCPL